MRFKPQTFGTLVLAALLAAFAIPALAQGVAAPAYADYLARYDVRAQSEGVLEASPLGQVTEFQGRQAQCLIEGGELSFMVNCPAPGLYHIGLSYYPLDVKGLNLEYALEIDNQAPFREAQYLSLYRIWVDKYPPGSQQDALGNDLIPGQEESPAWSDTLIQDYTGNQQAPYLFFLDQGRHEITVRMQREAMAIARLWFVNSVQAISYEEAVIW